MIRSFAATAAAVATLALAGAAAAQTWGQPVYLNAYGRPVGGSPLSEVETRSYVGTGRWADGYADRPRAHVPAPGYDRHHRDRRQGGLGYGYGHGQERRYGGYGHRPHDPPPRPGYRDAWGYDDDRPPAARRWSEERRYRRDEGRCDCGDVYLYDR